MISLRRIIPIVLIAATLPLMGQRCSSRSDGSVGGSGGCSGGQSTQGDGTTPEGGGGGALPSSKDYTFKRGEIGSTYNTGSSRSSNYKTSTQLGWFLSEGATLSDSYRTFHPMGLEIIKRPPTLKAKEEENPTGNENLPE